jgi:hypothetical protein
MLISESKLRMIVRSVLLENNEIPEEAEEFGDEGEFGVEGLLKSLKPWSFNLLKFITFLFDEKMTIANKDADAQNEERLKDFTSGILEPWYNDRSRNKFTAEQKKEGWKKLIKEIEYYYRVKEYSVEQISEMLLPENGLWLDFVACCSRKKHIGFKIWKDIGSWLDKHQQDLKSSGFSED